MARTYSVLRYTAHKSGDESKPLSFIMASLLRCSTAIVSLCLAVTRNLMSAGLPSSALALRHLQASRRLNE